MNQIQEYYEYYPEVLNGGFSLKRLARKAASAFTGAPRAIAAAAQGDLKDFNLFENQSMLNSYRDALTGNAIVAGSLIGGELVAKGNDFLNQYAPDGYGLDLFGNRENNAQPQQPNQAPQSSHNKTYSPTQTAGIGKGALILGALLIGGIVVSRINTAETQEPLKGLPVAH